LTVFNLEEYNYYRNTRAKEDSIMKKLLILIAITLLVCILAAGTASAGRFNGRGGGFQGRGHYGGHGGHGYYGGRGYYGHGGHGYYDDHHGYYNGCGSYSNWAVGIGLGLPLFYDYGPAYYAAPVYAQPAYYVPSGYWTVQKVWVPVSSQSYWVNQYYDQSRNVWVLGHWETRSTGGYWTEQQVWVQQ
jgi:hypothetical protein